MFWFTNTRRRSDKPTRPRNRPTRLRLEWLEDRRLLCNLGPGSLDESFGIGGKVTTDFGAAELARAVAIQPDGKIVAAGMTGTSGISGDIAVARYNADGSLDNTFSGDGKATTSFGARPARTSEVLIQPDGKIVAVATLNPVTAFQNSDFALVRYKADGSVDKTFGTSGKVTTGFSSGSGDSADGAVLQPDGKIVVVGSTTNGSTSIIAAARYNPNGTLDTTFSGDGKMTTALARGARDVTLQADGKIILAGAGFTLVRLNSDGSVDTSFGTAGAATAPLNGNALAVAVQQDGKFVAAGFIYDANGVEDHALARYNPDGSLDTTFDGDGMRVVSLSSDNDSAQDLAIQSDGKIVTAGRAVGSAAILRFNSDGSLDNGFGTGGVVTTANGGGLAMAIQSDGKIVSAGSAGGDFALARYCA